MINSLQKSFLGALNTNNGETAPWVHHHQDIGSHLTPSIIAKSIPMQHAQECEWNAEEMVMTVAVPLISPPFLSAYHWPLYISFNVWVFSVSTFPSSIKFVPCIILVAQNCEIDLHWWILGKWGMTMSKFQSGYSKRPDVCSVYRNLLQKKKWNLKQHLSLKRS